MAEQSKKNGKNEIDTRLGALRADLETLQSDMKGLVDDVEGGANDRVRSAIQHAETVAERGYHLAQDAVVHATDDVEHWAQGNLDTARTSVRAQPLAAIAVSLGAGALLGVILGAIGYRASRACD